MSEPVTCNLLQHKKCQKCEHWLGEEEFPLLVRGPNKGIACNKSCPCCIEKKRSLKQTKKGVEKENISPSLIIQEHTPKFTEDACDACT